MGPTLFAKNRRWRRSVPIASMNVGTKVDSSRLCRQADHHLPPTEALPRGRDLNETKSFAWAVDGDPLEAKPPTPPFDFGDALPERVAASVHARTSRPPTAPSRPSPTASASEGGASGVRERGRSTLTAQVIKGLRRRMRSEVRRSVGRERAGGRLSVDMEPVRRRCKWAVHGVRSRATATTFRKPLRRTWTCVCHVMVMAPCLTNLIHVHAEPSFLLVPERATLALAAHVAHQGRARHLEPKPGLSALADWDDSSSLFGTAPPEPDVVDVVARGVAANDRSILNLANQGACHPYVQGEHVSAEPVPWTGISNELASTTSHRPITACSAADQSTARSWSTGRSRLRWRYR